MDLIDIGGSGLEGSAIALGCMRIDALAVGEVAELVGTALDAGITLFDHADIYGGGRCEEVFGEAMHRLGLRRDDVLLQSKCGIAPGRYDLSAGHIVASVEGSLARLRTDHLDLFLLHRPDTLVEPAEVAEAFDALHAAGKVRHFGVSNHSASSLALLQRHVRQPLVTNQLQFSLAHTGMIDSGLNANMATPASLDHDGGILEHCRLHGITIQPWSVLQYGYFAGTFIGSPEHRELNDALDDLAETYSATAAAVAIAWILRHPARMLPVIGTTRPSRVRELADAARIRLTGEEWYGLYRAAGNSLP